MSVAKLLYNLKVRRQYRGYKMQSCSQCGTLFYLTSIERSFYTAQDLDQPTKCRCCLRTERESFPSHVVNG